MVVLGGRRFLMSEVPLYVCLVTLLSNGENATSNCLNDFRTENGSSRGQDLAWTGLSVPIRLTAEAVSCLQGYITYKKKLP